MPLQAEHHFDGVPVLLLFRIGELLIFKTRMTAAAGVPEFTQTVQRSVF